MKRYVVILLIVLGSIPVTHAQTMPEVEQQIKGYVDALSYWRYESKDDDTTYNGERVSVLDPLTAINNKLEEYILTVVGTKQSAMLTYSFNSLKGLDFNTVTSEDKKFRIISWDSHLGAQAPAQMISIIVYESGHDLFALRPENIRTSGTNNVKDDGYQASDFSAVFTVSAIEGGKYYLAVYKDMYSDMQNVTKAIIAYSVENSELKRVPVFKTGDSLVDELSYDYDYSSNYDFEKMKEIHTVHLSKNGKKLYVPAVANNQMTGKWQVYNFDGSKFVYDTTE